MRRMAIEEGRRKKDLLRVSKAYKMNTKRGAQKRMAKRRRKRKKERMNEEKERRRERFGFCVQVERKEK